MLCFKTQSEIFFYFCNVCYQKSYHPPCLNIFLIFKPRIMTCVISTSWQLRDTSSTGTWWMLRMDWCTPGACECGSRSHCLALLRAFCLGDSRRCHRAPCNVPQRLPIPALHRSTKPKRGTRAFPGFSLSPSSAAISSPSPAFPFPCQIPFCPLSLLPKQQFPSLW